MKQIEEIWMIRKWREILGREEHKARQDMFNTDSIALRTLKQNIAKTQHERAYCKDCEDHECKSQIGKYLGYATAQDAQYALTRRQHSQTLLCCMLAMWNGNLHLKGEKRGGISPLRRQFEVCLNKFCPDKVDEILEEFECEDWDEYRLMLEGKPEELEEYKSYKKIIGGKMWNGSVTLAE